MANHLEELLPVVFGLVDDFGVGEGEPSVGEEDEDVGGWGESAGLGFHSDWEFELLTRGEMGFKDNGVIIGLIWGIK